jgi:RHS repeat-associated protein
MRINKLKIFASITVLSTIIMSGLELRAQCYEPYLWANGNNCNGYVSSLMAETYVDYYYSGDVQFEWYKNGSYVWTDYQWASGWGTYSVQSQFWGTGYSGDTFQVKVNWGQCWDMWSYTYTVPPANPVYAYGQGDVCNGIATFQIYNTPGASVQVYRQYQGYQYYLYPDNNGVYRDDEYQFYQGAQYFVQAYYGGCSSYASEIYMNDVTPPQPTVSPSSAVACAGSGALLTASPNWYPDESYRWYNTSGQHIATGRTYVAYGPVYVEINYGGACPSPWRYVPFTTSSPSAPTAYASSVCGPGQISVTASTGFTSYKWFNADGTLIQGQTGRTLTTNVSNSTYFYVSGVNNYGCESPRSSPVYVSVPETGSGGIWPASGGCNGYITGLYAYVPTAGTSGYFYVTWYRDGSYAYQEEFYLDGNEWEVQSYYNGIAYNGQTFEVRATYGNGSCPPLSIATYTVNFTSPYAYGYGTRCNNTVTFEVTGTPGASFTVYREGGDGGQYYLYPQNGVYTDPDYYEGANFHYYVRATYNGCYTSPSEMYVDDITPQLPTLSPATPVVCVGGSALLTAGPSWYPAESIKWYSPQGTQVGTGYTYAAATAVQVGIDYNGCSGPRRYVSITTSAPAAPPGYSSSVCGPGTAYVSAGGNYPSYRWYDAYGNLIPGQTSSTATVHVDYSTYFYAAGVNSYGCESPKSQPILLTVTQQIPYIATVGTACNGYYSGLKAYLDAEGYAGEIRFKWYRNGTLISQDYQYLQGTEPVIESSYNGIAYNGEQWEVKVQYGGCPELSSGIYNVQGQSPFAWGMATACHNKATFTINATPGAYLYVYRVEGGQEYPLYAQNGVYVDDYYYPENNYHYYVRASIGGCTTYPSEMWVEDITPMMPTVSPPGPVSLCPGTVTELTASSWGYNDGDFRWYNTNGTLNANTSSHHTASSTTYVSVYDANYQCEGNRRTVTINVDKVKPPTPQTETSITTCAPGSVSLVAHGTYAAFKWYNAQGTLITDQTGAWLTTDITAGTSFQVKGVSADQCDSDPVTIQVSTVARQYGCENYIATTDVAVEGVTTLGGVAGLNATQAARSITYFDGIGRPKQTVAREASPAAKDMVYPVVYDEYGRKPRAYLPYAVDETTGLFKTVTYQANGDYVNDFYRRNNDAIANDTKPFSDVIYEPSPLNRVTKETGTGRDWQTQNRSTNHGYLSNTHGTGTGQEKVVAWTLDASGMPIRYASTSTPDGFYATGTLTVKNTNDEDGHVVREYMQLSGRVILKKVQAGTGTSDLNDANAWAQTYYIHDDFGKLRFVIQPELTKVLAQSDTYNPTADDLDRFAFQYRYDAKQRMTHKKVPGSDVVYMVYDKRNRLVMTQDGKQRKDADGNALTLWSYTKYDVLNRPIITGTYYHGTVADQATMAGQISTTQMFETYNGAPSDHGYTNNVFPTTGTTVLTVNYYDNYRFRDEMAGAQYNYQAGDLTNQPANYNPDVKGAITGTKANVLGTSTYLWSVSYYDQKYRGIQAKLQHHKNGIDRETSLYDFLRLKESLHTHSKDGTTYSRHKKYDYDHYGRVVNGWHKFHNEPFVLVQKNVYNELGQLAARKLHRKGSVGDDFWQSIDYTYNIRGWLRKINDPTAPVPDDLFNMELKYQDAGSTGSPIRYDGNISEATWQVTGFDQQAYGYRYDGMNRLVEGNYYNFSQPTQNGRYSEFVGDGVIRPAYDLNGNIKNLVRFGKRPDATFGKIDDLSYIQYQGNQVMQIADSQPNSSGGGFTDGAGASDEFAYDANGNLKKDANKGITSIAYNTLNLVARVDKSATDYVIYTYDATGRKLAQEVFGTTPKVTDYMSGYVYENNALKYFTHEVGRIVPDPGGPMPWVYQYNLTDHLGNVRLTFTTKEDPSLTTATLETSNMQQEQSQYLNYNEAVVVDHELFDHTHDGIAAATNKATRLLGGTSERYGLARSLRVMPGDQINMEVYAKYLDPDPANWQGAFEGFLSAYTSSPAAGAMVDQGVAGSIGNAAFPYASVLGRAGANDNAPKVFLTWLVFDKDFQPLPAKCGFVQITTAARENGTNVSHERLAKATPLQINQPGYVYVYISNENETPVEVFFDDFTVEQIQSPIIQVDDYYPFGMTYNSYSRDNSQQDYLYTGKEKQDELGLDWYDHGARMYDAGIGRWMVADPMSHKMRRWSPYAYAFDNPVRFIDPEGMTPYVYNWETGQYENDKGQRVEWNEVYQSMRDNGDLQTGMVIFVAFPDASPDIPTNQKIVKWGEDWFGNGDGKIDNAGHAGVVLINEKGETKYFDFGRYDRPDVKGKKRGKDEGSVRSSKNYRALAIPNWDFKKTDTENVTAILTKLHNSSLLSGYGKIVGALAKNLNYGAMLAYARAAESEGYLPFGGYGGGYDFCKSATYCAKFARAVGAAGGFDWDWNTFTGLGNVEDVVEEYEVEMVTLPAKK